MKTSKELLAIAIKQLGNTGGKYRKYVGGSGSWCDMFVFWLFDANGCGELIKWRGVTRPPYERTYCPSSIKWCRKNLAQIPLFLAMPCDIIYFDWDKNNNPNHIGIVESRKSTTEIKTIEGNTNGGKVARKTRPSKYVQAIYRPHFKGSYKLGALSIDGEFGYNSIANMQKALGITVDGVLGLATVKALQKKCGATVDGQWGAGTSKKVQKMIGVKQDGAFGVQSVKALQNWINKQNKVNPKPTPKPTPTPTPKPTPTLKSYKISVDLTNQICTVYGVYSDGSLKGIMSEWVSTAKKGCVTPTGNFKIEQKLRTAKMSGGKSYAEFLIRFHGHKCMHTVPYSKRQTTGHVNKNAFNKLGTPQSAGCVRMPWKLAHYIYTNCPVGTPVTVFKGKLGDYPKGKPTKYKATTDIDPTYKK